MGRRRKPPPGASRIDGWLVIDKPEGPSSAAVVAMLRRSLRPLRIGHGGTLDPLASGVLPIALGEATKTVAYAMDAGKTYRFTLRFGIARDSDDAEGRIVGTSDVRPATPAVEAMLSRFIGIVDQRPPAFSAVHVAGKRAYHLARAGQAVSLSARPVRIDRLTLLARPDADHAEFEMVCGKGTYVRSLARDLALALGTVGHVARLRRTSLGPFRETSAILLENALALGHSAAALSHLLPIETVLDDIPALAVTEEEATALSQGQSLRVGSTGDVERDRLPSAGGGPSPADSLIRVHAARRLVALVRRNGEVMRPVRVFNLEDGVHDVDYR